MRLVWGLVEGFEVFFGINLKVKLRRNVPVKPGKVGVMIRLPSVGFFHLCRSKLNFLHALLLARSGYISAWSQQGVCSEIPSSQHHLCPQALVAVKKCMAMGSLRCGINEDKIYCLMI